MAFLETPRFPVDLNYGSLGGPINSTDIVTTGNGVEYRNANWSRPLYRYNAKYNIKTRTQALEIYEFFLTSQGKLNGFRVKDIWDYTSATNGVDALARTDQTIGTGDNSETVFQMIKTYTQGANTQVRNIKKIVSGTQIIEVNSVLQTEGVDYTIDITTGIITFITTPPNTHVIKAGYEFDIPCRFDTDDLSDLAFLVNATAGADTDLVSFGDIPLVEIRI